MAYSAEIDGFLSGAETDRVVGIVYVGQAAMEPTRGAAANVDSYLRFPD